MFELTGYSQQSGLIKMFKRNYLNSIDNFLYFYQHSAIYLNNEHQMLLKHILKPGHLKNLILPEE